MTHQLSIQSGRNVQRSGGWLNEAITEYEKDPDFVAESLAIGLIEQAIELMEARNMTRTELAGRMGVSKAYVTKLFNAPPNLTLRSIAGVAVALGAEPSVSLLPREPMTVGVDPVQDRQEHIAGVQHLK